MPYLKRQLPQPEPVDCRILTAALDLFVQQGYHNISIHEIQKRANVSIGSIYNHFGGKEGVARALYKHLLNELDELLRDVELASRSPLKQSQQIITELFAYTETHRTIISYIFHAKHAEFLPEEPHTCESAAFIRMRRVVENGMACGEFREMDPVVATAMVFGGPIRMIQLRLENQITEPLSAYLHDTLEAIWQGMCPPNGRGVVVPLHAVPEMKPTVRGLA